jgi:heme/copper-type cytochrome/quinol oxidase subunit 3
MPEPRVIDPASHPAARRRPFVDNASLGMALFVFTEVMLFAGLISAFIIVQSGAPAGNWPPPGQPRLPIARTALNTVALLASGACLFVAGRRFRGPDPARAASWMGAALALGAFFVVFQGAEWVALLGQGLTLTSSQMGSFFYLIVGTHALHAVAAILALAAAWRALRAGRLTPTRLSAVAMFWYFVVLVWPVLYWKVYL